ncbi:hypothetical protein Leryth_005144 [Lithospermum erythrorhizon]|nr:hypothetical protein Leryth_005144 [Lithospermum erythrorhizon]
MAKQSIMSTLSKRNILIPLLVFSMLIMLPNLTLAKKRGGRMNVIDRCWRRDPNWRNHREQLARCSVGYVGKMNNNIGGGLTWYIVSDPSDDAIHPKPGTLRYGVTQVKGKKWITFKHDMKIKLAKPLLVGSFTTIDGRGAKVEIAGGACLILRKVTDVIIHSLKIRDCKAQPAGDVLNHDGAIMSIGPVDGDAIRMISCAKIWIDHNTLATSPDGLIDVTRGSTDITISNNQFIDQNKVMLLGHDDGFLRDRNMKVTVAYNKFGPNCHQRMPRVRFGYSHVVNNIYKGWGLYAIGGSMDPSVRSEANLFIAPKNGKKEVTWRKAMNIAERKKINFQSIKDIFENGASFKESDGDGNSVKPNYNKEQYFRIAVAINLRKLTRAAGALKCPPVGRC